MYTTTRAQYEAALARAHRAVWSAGEAAEALGERGALSDLLQLLGELTRISDDSASGRRRRHGVLGSPNPAQLTVRI